MGLFDNLGGAIKGLAGQAEAAALPALLSAVLAKTDLKDMQGLLDKLQQSGLGPQVSSWLGDGKNLPITADQLRSNEQIKDQRVLVCQWTRYWRLLLSIFQPLWTS